MVRTTTVIVKTDSEPNCLSNGAFENSLIVKEHDIIELTCSVNYSGNWAPVMKWQQDEGPVITDGRVVNNAVPYMSVIYSLTVRASRDMTGSKFSCTTYFSKNNKPANTSAKNVPDYIFTWTSLVAVIPCE